MHHMPKTIEFGMYWEMYGRQTVDIPDDIDENDDDAVKEYIKKVWDDIGLPNGNYIDESARLDEDADINIVRK